MRTRNRIDVAPDPAETPEEPEATESNEQAAPTAAPAAGAGTRLAGWSLRLGLAFVFLYAALSSWLHPETFAGYFPEFLPSSWATELLPVFAGYELVLALALLSGRWTRPAAFVAGLTLAAITASNPDAFEVLFRNVAIACAAVALFALSPARPARASGRLNQASTIEVA